MWFDQVMQLLKQPQRPLSMTFATFGSPSSPQSQFKKTLEAVGTVSFDQAGPLGLSLTEISIGLAPWHKLHAEVKSAAGQSSIKGVQAGWLVQAIDGQQRKPARPSRRTAAYAPSI